MKVETSRCHFYPVGVFYYFINQKCFFLLYCNDLAKLKLDTNLSYLTARNYLARSIFLVDTQLSEWCVDRAQNDDWL